MTRRTGKTYTNTKKRSKEVKIILKREFAFSTENVLDIVRRAEADSVARSAKKSTRKRTISEIDSTEKEEIVENNSESSDSDCIVVMSRI